MHHVPPQLPSQFPWLSMHQAPPWQFPSHPPQQQVPSNLPLHAPCATTIALTIPLAFHAPSAALAISFASSPATGSIESPLTCTMCHHNCPHNSLGFPCTKRRPGNFLRILPSNRFHRISPYMHHVPPQLPSQFPWLSMHQAPP